MSDNIFSQLIFSARSKSGGEEYADLQAFGLSVELNKPGSDAVSEQLLLTISAEEDFEGVIRIAMPVGNGSPRFYLPGFMYGTNRGEAYSNKLFHIFFFMRIFLL